MSDSRTTELLPCPFCGGKAALRMCWMEDGHKYRAVECVECGATTPGNYSEVGDQSAWDWNTRTPEQAIAATLGSEINGETSDGYHTFNELYHHRAVLFSVIVRDHRGIAWKARKHYDGTMYDGMFIVGIETPKGQATYHYDLDPYWEMFDCEERDFAPKWDGHTPDDAIARIAELGSEPPYDELIRYLENDWNISASWDGLRKFWCIELTEEGVKLRDAVYGTLTAEQVREVIDKHGINDGLIYSVLKGSFQAIADELNATLGGGKLTAEQLRDAINELQKKQPYCYDPDKPLDTLKTIGRYIGELESTVLRMYREHPIAQFEQWIEDLGLNEADAWKPRTLGSEREKALEELVRDLFDRGKYFNPERYGIKALTKRARNLGIEVNL